VIVTTSELSLFTYPFIMMCNLVAVEWSQWWISIAAGCFPVI